VCVCVRHFWKVTCSAGCLICAPPPHRGFYSDNSYFYVLCLCCMQFIPLLYKHRLQLSFQYKIGDVWFGKIVIDYVWITIVSAVRRGTVDGSVVCRRWSNPFTVQGQKIFTQGFHDFPQTLQTNVGIIQGVRKVALHWAVMYRVVFLVIYTGSSESHSTLGCSVSWSPTHA
jgi:hypothetical protein